MRRAVLRGRHRAARGNHIFSDLGFGVGMWNGLDSGHGISLLINCGASTPLFPNTFTIHLPDDLGPLKRSGRMQAILASVISAWEPDHASVVSNQFLRRSRRKSKTPFVDWMVYISDRWMPNPPQIERPASSKKLAEGTLIVVQNQPTDIKNPTHAQNIRRVRNAIRPRLRIPVPLNQTQDDK